MALTTCDFVIETGFRNWTGLRKKFIAPPKIATCVGYGSAQHHCLRPSLKGAPESLEDPGKFGERPQF